jgi:vitamin B12 transporter
VGDEAGWQGRLGATVIGSSNRNYLSDTSVNRTGGGRWTIDGQLSRGFSTGPIQHRMIVAGDFERETFTSRDVFYGGATNQNRNRSHSALTAEWHAEAGRWVTDFAVRRDMFNRFRDATSVRASLRADIGAGFALAGSYAEGIAQPTFFDLYGFFPGNFVGNPDLKPESSHGMEASLRFHRPRVSGALTVYVQRLDDEIVDNATFTSVVNSPGTSRRKGVEAELAWKPTAAVRLTANYAYVKATQPAGSLNRQLEEWRRPKHSGSIAVDGSSGQLSYGASLAYVGSHLDRQEVLPFAIVRLDRYLLASARVAYRLDKRVELFARATNLLNQDYEDSAGYRTEGRGLFAGVRLSADRRSSP